MFLWWCTHMPASLLSSYDCRWLLPWKFRKILSLLNTPSWRYKPPLWLYLSMPKALSDVASALSWTNSLTLAMLPLLQLISFVAFFCQSTSVFENLFTSSVSIVAYYLAGDVWTKFVYLTDVFCRWGFGQSSIQLLKNIRYKQLHRSIKQL